jgi:glycine betaine catabolism B
MLKYLDALLDRITMYRLTLYYLLGLVGSAALLSAVGILHLDPFALLFTTAFLVAACAIANWVFARAFGVPANTESVYITALILALIVAPLQSYQDLWFLGWMAIWAMASKYIVAVNGKHLFNPAAFAVALTYFTLNQSANWWVGSAPLLPLVALGGILIVRKTRRADLVGTFLLAAVAAVVLLGTIAGEDLGLVLPRLVLDSPLLFFAFVFLTEPMTMPAIRQERLFYAAIVGFLFAPEFHVGSFYMTPELAIMFGNFYAYLVSPKANLLLTLREKIQVAPDIYDFIFEPSRKLAFEPGQYMEWTLAHADPDTRGNRRYFTLASSPTEDTVRLGVKFYENSSTLKQSLLAMHPQDEILATHLAGDFVLPEDPRQKCVFIAGGIGVTPFRSMLQYLLDLRQRRPITVFFVNKTAKEIVYKDVFDRAREVLGIKTVYTLTDPYSKPAGWQGKTGRITAQMIKAEVPDYKDCIFYISGPQAMVDASKAMLRSMHVRESHIKTDYFSGLA